MNGIEVALWDVKHTLDCWRRKRTAHGRGFSQHCQSPTAQAQRGHPDRVTLPCWVHARLTSDWVVDWAAHAIGPKGTTDKAGMLECYRALAAAFPFRWCPGFEPLANVRLIERLPVSRTAHLERRKRAAGRRQIDFEALAVAASDLDPDRDEAALRQELADVRELEASVAVAIEREGPAWITGAVGDAWVVSAAKFLRAPELLTFDRATVAGRAALVARLKERMAAVERVADRLERAMAARREGSAPVPAPPISCSPDPSKTGAAPELSREHVPGRATAGARTPAEFAQLTGRPISLRHNSE